MKMQIKTAIQVKDLRSNWAENNEQYQCLVIELDKFNLRFRKSMLGKGFVTQFERTLQDCLKNLLIIASKNTGTNQKDIEKYNDELDHTQTWFQDKLKTLIDFKSVKTPRKEEQDKLNKRAEEEKQKKLNNDREMKDIVNQDSDEEQGNDPLQQSAKQRLKKVRRREPKSERLPVLQGKAMQGD